ncbi:AAA domain family protein [Escherichia coli 1-250-04_S3_C2]|nr:AAA domain family protein [Escherichia coli 1-250-04_S3_C2]
MSLSIVHTRAALGVNAPPITVEVHISKGLPGLTMVGLPETTVKEARDRVRSAIINSGYEYPAKKITINLAPADLPKEGGRYDLPIAIALLAASEQLTANKLDEYELVGELALTGALHGVPGAISSATEAIKSGRKIIVAKDNEDEVGLINGEGCLIADHLQAVCAFLEGKHTLERPKPTDAVSRALQHDLSDVVGQEQEKRGLEITAAGGHNLLLIGPPGTGKTMLASRINGLLPDLSNEEALESAAILSLVNAESVQKQWRQRPFRSPHHSAGNDSNLLIVFYVQIMPDDFVMQLHRFENDSDFRPSRARCCLRFRLCRSIRCVYRLLITCSFPFRRDSYSGQPSVIHITTSKGDSRLIRRPSVAIVRSPNTCATTVFRSLSYA